MFGRFQVTKDTAVKIIAAIIVSSIFLLTVSVLTDSHDSRKQISDDSGASEAALCSFLSDVKGVGEVSVMMEYGEKGAVSGVIVTAQGADNPVVKNDIAKGVATLFDIPVSSVMVFEKNQEENSHENKQQE